MPVGGCVPAGNGRVADADEGGGGGGGDVGGFAGFRERFRDDVYLLRFEDLFAVVVRHGHAVRGAGDETLGGGPLGGFAVGERGAGFGVVGQGGGAVAAELVGVVAMSAAVVVSTGAGAVAGEVVFFCETGFGEAHELVEDGEFELEFDGVDHGFYGGFADVVVGEFEADEDDVHADADAVDEEELEHHFAGHAVVDGAQEADGGDNVDGGDDEFLDAEAC